MLQILLLLSKVTLIPIVAKELEVLCISTSSKQYDVPTCYFMAVNSFDIYKFTKVELHGHA